MTSRSTRTGRATAEGGYTLIELMISVAIMTIVSASALEGVFRLTKVNKTITNRTEMHSGVRNATELLQQEVGQAGRIALPNSVQLAAAVASGPSTVVVNAVNASGTVMNGANGTTSMFVGEQVVVDTGANEETVTLTGVNSANRQITATFSLPHAAGAAVQVYGGFGSGVVPTTVANGSSGTVLKLIGDINSDGMLKLVEYRCDTGTGNLYRRMVAFDATSKPSYTADLALLNNIIANPDGTPCFTYQQATVNNVPYVIDVAITLTVETMEPDPVTGLKERETKALLNVSPRNVFNVWQLAGLGISNRVQPLPSSITTLLTQP